MQHLVSPYRSQHHFLHTHTHPPHRHRALPPGFHFLFSSRWGTASRATPRSGAVSRNPPVGRRGGPTATRHRRPAPRCPPPCPSLLPPPPRPARSPTPPSPSSPGSARWGAHSPRGRRRLRADLGRAGGTQRQTDTPTDRPTGRPQRLPAARRRRPGPAPRPRPPTPRGGRERRAGEGRAEPPPPRPSAQRGARPSPGGEGRAGPGRPRGLGRQGLA